MLLYCKYGHLFNNQDAAGDLCAVCMKERPDEIKCKDLECPAIETMGPIHFHPSEEGIFYDPLGRRINFNE